MSQRLTDEAEPVLVGRFDFVHSLRVLVNLIENAHKYSAQGTAIEITALREGERLVFRVEDRGHGFRRPTESRSSSRSSGASGSRRAVVPV